MAWEAAVAGDHVELLKRLREVLIGYPLVSSPVIAGTGNGTLHSLHTFATTPVETWTLTCTTGGASAVFSVVGSVSGAQASASVGGAYDNGKIAFQIANGTANFAVNDTIVFSTQSNGLAAQPWVVERWHGAGAQPVGYFASSQYSSGNAAAKAFDDTTSAYWMSASGGHVNSHLGVEFSKPIEIRKALLASYFSSTQTDRSIKDFHIQYSDDGVAWTTDTTVTGQTAWQGGEYRSFSLSGTAGAHRFWRVYVTANNGDTAFTVINELRLHDAHDLVNVAKDGDGPEMIVRGPGSSGSDQIYCGVRAYRNQAGDWYNWRLQGYTGFSSSLLFDLQPGALNAYPPQVCWLDQPFRYWIVANGRRFMVFGRVGAGYEGCYLGFLLPYATPAQYPYPLFIGGTITGNAQADYSNYLHRNFDNYDHRLFVDPGVYGGAGGSESTGYSAARLRMPSGNWKSAHNRYQGGSGSVNIARSAGTLGVYPWISNLFGSAYYAPPFMSYPGGSYAHLVAPQRDGQHLLLPAILTDFESSANCGELEGVKFVTGQGNSAENSITVGSETWTVFTNLNKAGNDNFFAVRLS